MLHDKKNQKIRNTDLSLIGVPFVDTIVLPSSDRSGDVIRSEILMGWGGVSNCQKLADSLGCTVFYLINDRLLPQFMNWIETELARSYRVIDSNLVRHINAVVLADSISKTRKSYLSNVERTVITVSISELKSYRKHLCFYIEDFCLNALSFCQEDDILLFDYNSNEGIVNWNDGGSHVADNLYRADYIFCSDNELDGLMNYVSGVRKRFPLNVNLNKKVIVHSAKFICIKELKIFGIDNLECMEVMQIKNEWYTKEPKTVIGNGDRFALLFSSYIEKSSSILEVVKATQKHLYNLLTT